MMQILIDLRSRLPEQNRLAVVIGDLMINANFGSHATGKVPHCPQVFDTSPSRAE